MLRLQDNNCFEKARVLKLLGLKGWASGEAQKIAKRLGLGAKAFLNLLEESALE